jgi:hypothetical protein
LTAERLARVEDGQLVNLTRIVDPADWATD